MKSLFSPIIFLFGFFAFCQDATSTQSELDSLFNKRVTKIFKIIENVPLYKGCEKLKSNAKKKQCMSQKIAQLFNDNFNTIIPEGSNLSPGLEIVFLTFKVDVDGKVTDINAEAKDDYLINEAVRVAKLIPNLKPGHIRGKPVKVPYTLPLKINLEPKEKGASTYPVFRGCDKDMSNEESKKCSIEKLNHYGLKVHRFLNLTKVSSTRLLKYKRICIIV